MRAAGRGIARRAAVFVAVALFGWAARAEGTGSGCGSGSAAIAAAVDGLVAHDIYANELAGSEVTADSGHVAAARDLVAAVAARDAAAAKRAVLRIVFHPHWHIVRLRVLDRSGHLLADVGGRDTIAPVAGTLRAGGAVVGRFLMSVQDDIGVAKLETRFVGDAVGMYVGGGLVAALDPRLPETQPLGVSLRLGSVSYRVVAEVDRAFPSGSVTLVLLVAPPPAALAARPCAAVRAAEFGKVAERLAQLAVDLPRHYGGFAATVTLYSGALVFVRDGGRRLASSGGAGPALRPGQRRVAYEGRMWLVDSFVVASPARIYVLAPAA
jgi:hypothetical protein